MGLKRALTFWPTVLYGMGTILGAGIYVLVGKVAGFAGPYAPLSFLVAALIALFTALSYGRLASRYPKAAGEAVYVQEGLRSPRLAMLTGWLVVITGVISAATLANGCVGYLQVLVDLPRWSIICAFVLVLGAIAAWGIVESVALVMAITLIEVGGLLFVLVIATPEISLPETASFQSGGLFLGAFLAFYAFIGFEDMVNLAEEVKEPRRTLPKAILTALILSTLLYILVTLALVLALPTHLLSESEAPLALLFTQRGLSPVMITVISLIAIVNGALVQIVMASRVLYGMARQNIAPAPLAQVHPRRHTPLLATLLVTLIILTLALWFPLVGLAQATSLIILIVFALVNLALMQITWREKKIPFVATLGCLLSIGLAIAWLVF